MNQPPKTLVSPDDLVAFIRKANVSEEAATGLKLMRQAAETIAWLDDELRRARNEPKAAAADDDNVELLDQVAHALGADFHEKHQIYGLNEILQHIDDLHAQLDGLQQGIIERDRVIEELEKPVNIGPADGIEIKFADSFVGEAQSTGDDQSVGCGDTIDRHKWIKKATEFAHKVHGATLVMEETKGMRDLQGYADWIIDNSPAN